MITKDMTIGELLKQEPDVAPVLLRLSLSEKQRWFTTSILMNFLPRLTVLLTRKRLKPLWQTKRCQRKKAENREGSY